MAGARNEAGGMTGGRRRQRMTAAVLFGVAAGMVGLSFASVPLYRLFCQVTGYAGTPRTEDVARSAGVTDRQVTVRFDANVNSKLPWRFLPAQRQVTANLGEERLIFYEAANLSDEPVTGTATFNVTPEKAARYFVKIECFCFTEQTLAPGEKVTMPVVFYVDPELAADADAGDVSKITLSYTFFPIDGGGDAPAERDKVAATPAGADRG
jgi:cytochrome c oxidase assembly protein subunit 11